MPFLRAGQLARFTPSARPDDTLGLVAENIRSSHYGSIPVLDRVVLAEDDPQGRQARVLGLIDERDLGRAVLPGLGHIEAARRVAVGAAPDFGSVHPNGFHTAESNGSAPDAEPANAATLTARQVMRSDYGVVPAAFSLHNALLALDRYETGALPVLDENGSYRGMISRADVVAALGQQVRPPTVGGMATPLGVWLTTGNLNAGAPPLGLFLSGLMMGSCFVVVWLVMLLGLGFIDPNLQAIFNSGRLGAMSEAGGALNFLFTFVQGGLFLLLFRLLPIAGIHAAEHQTVWAIERGLPLTPEIVSKMPRAHPRCGTNLLALAGLIQIIFQHLPSNSPALTLISLVFVFFAWRSFGTIMQQYFTTRPASPRQLESGIRAGKELLEKYQAQPHVIGSFGARLFNSGLGLSALGMIIMTTLLNVFMAYVAQFLNG